MSKEDLIISKLSWAKDSHSEIQLGDVRNLLGTGYDAKYVARWTRELELVNLLKECLIVTDTSPEIERMVRNKIMARSGEERFIIGAEMFDSAREMVKASLPKNLSETEMRRLLFKRIYGKELEIGPYGSDAG